MEIFVIVWNNQQNARTFTRREDAEAFAKSEKLTGYQIIPVSTKPH